MLEIVPRRIPRFSAKKSSSSIFYNNVYIPPYYKHNMKWVLNFLVKVLGAFLTSYGILMTQQTPVSPGWVIGLFTVGLASLFAPKIEK
jgi:hypothetical protein